METTNAIQQIYIGLLGRAADQEGLQYWTDEIEAGTLTLEQLRANIVEEQPEYEATFGGQTRAQVVSQLYANLFNRAPDDEGLQYWVNGEGASVNIDQLVLALVNGAAAADTLVLDNRTEVANYYTEELGAEGSFDAELAGAVIADVDGTRASVTQAKASVDNGDITAPTPNEGNTFTLTTAIDNVEGTAGNDTIIGGAGSAAGASTLGAADVINGGAGTDKLQVTLEGTTPSVTPNLTNVETVSAQALSNGGASINLVNATGVTKLENNNSTDALAFTNVQDLATASVVKGNSSNTDVKFVDSLVAGTADAVSINLDNAKAGFLSVAGTTAGGFETANITAAAGKSTVNVLSTASGNVSALAAALQTAQTDANLIGGVNVAFDTNEGTTEAAYAAAVNATAASAAAKTDAIAAFNAIQGSDGTTTVAANAAGAASTDAAVTAASNALGAVTNTTTKTINIDGAGSVKLSDIAETVTTIDASNNTGGVDVHVDAGSARDVVITGGSGDDQVRMENTLTALDKVDGGAGRDTIHITNGAALIDGLQVTNFEKLDIAVGTGTYNMSKLAGIDTLVVSNSLQNAGAVVNNLAKGAEIVLGGENTAADLIGAGDLAVNVKDAGAGSANDVVGINVNSKVGVNTAAGSDIVVGNIETVNIAASSANAGVIHNFGGAVELAHALTINVNADSAALTLGNLEALALVDFNASASTKAVSITTGGDKFTAAAGTAFKLGAGNDTLDLTGATGGNAGTGATDYDFVITGGKGGDNITLANGANTDLLVYAAGDSKAGIVAGENQFDTIANFTTTTDKIDLKAFDFSGSLVSDVKAGNIADVSATTGAVNADKLANFFGAGGDQRAVVAVDAAVGASDVWVYVDANKDGSFQADTDMVIKLSGLADADNPVIDDFNFA
jgi:hypothetical protein